MERIGSEAQDPVNFRYWGYALNYQFPEVGGCQQPVAAADQVLFTFDSFGKPLLRAGRPARAPRSGRLATVTVTDGTTGQPLEGATIAGVPGASGPDGRLDVSFETEGVRTLKAERPGSVRSNTLEVCVERAGSGLVLGVRAHAVGRAGRRDRLRRPRRAHQRAAQRAHVPPRPAAAEGRRWETTRAACAR